jgi:hypothetical protein
MTVFYRVEGGDEMAVNPVPDAYHIITPTWLPEMKSPPASFAFLNGLEKYIIINGAHFLLYSHDPAADQAVLQEILASNSVPAQGGRRILALPPAEIATHPGSGKFVQRHADHDLQGIILYLICDDLAEAIEALEEKDIHCTEIEEAEFGLKTTILLPSGGEIGLYQPAHQMAIELDEA